MAVNVTFKGWGHITAKLDSAVRMAPDEAIPKHHEPHSARQILSDIIPISRQTGLNE